MRVHVHVRVPRAVGAATAAAASSHLGTVAVARVLVGSRVWAKPKVLARARRRRQGVFRGRGREVVMVEERRTLPAKSGGDGRRRKR